MTSVDNTARLISNSRWNLLSFGATLLINLITIPITIHLIGLPAFGGAGLILAVYAPFMLIGTVFSQALIKELAPLLTEASSTGQTVSSLFASAIYLASIACVTVVICLTVLSGSLARVLQDAAALSLDWQTCFLIAGIGWLTQQLSLVCQSYVAASQRYGALALANGIIALVSAALVVLCSSRWPSAQGFLLGTASGFTFALITWIWLLHEQLRGVLQICLPQREHVLHMLRFGRMQGPAHFLGAIGNQADRYMLGLTTPLAILGQFNVAVRLQEVVHMGLLKATEVLLPHFAVTANDPPGRRAEFFVRANWIFNILGACALAPMFPLADSLITLWIGSAATELGSTMLRTLTVAGIAGCATNLYYYLALGTNQQGQLAGLTSAHAVITVTLTTVAIWLFGPAAAGVGYLLANIARLLIAMWLIEHYFNRLLTRSSVLGSIAIPLGVSITISLLIFLSGNVRPESWAGLVASYILIGLLCILAIGTATALSRSGRKNLASALSLVRHKLADRG